MDFLEGYKGVCGCVSFNSWFTFIFEDPKFLPLVNFFPSPSSFQSGPLLSFEASFSELMLLCDCHLRPNICLSVFLCSQCSDVLWLLFNVIIVQVEFLFQGEL